MGQHMRPHKARPASALTTLYLQDDLRPRSKQVQLIWVVKVSARCRKQWFCLENSSLHNLKSLFLQFSFCARSIVLTLTKLHWFVSVATSAQIVTFVYKPHCFSLTLFLPVYWSWSVSYFTQLWYWNFNIEDWGRWLKFWKVQDSSHRARKKSVKWM